MVDVTVIIPFYNNIHNLDSALLSVTKQTLLPKKVIVIDDFSIHSKELNDTSLKEFPFELSILHNLDNLGVAESRNVGMMHSKTKYIAFLDEDDRWHPKKLEIQYKTMEKIESFISSTDYSLVDVKEEFINSMDLVIIELNFWSVLFRNLVNTSSVMIHYEVYNRFRFNPSLRYAEDYELWLKILKEHVIHLINIPLTIRSDGINHVGLSSNKIKMYQGELKTVDLLVSSAPIRYLVKIFISMKFIKRIFWSFLSRVTKLKS